MKFSTRTALGIEICDKRISLALLEQGKNGIELVKAVSGPVPAGAIKDGNIVDAMSLAKAIKELKKSNRIRAKKTAVSLFARPVLVQIVDVPKPVPANIRQFVQNEIKQCAVLPSQRIAFDFCGTGSAKREVGNRLLVVAADSQNLAEVARAYNQTGLSVEMIELALLAWTRAFFSKRIAAKFGSNVFMVMLQDSALTLCVFRNHVIDFIRMKDISKEKTEPNELCQRLAEEMKAVIQFYDVEVPESGGKWDITVVADSVQLPGDAEQQLKNKIACTSLQVRTSDNAWEDTPISSKKGFDKPSPTAIGLAMKLLDTKSNGLGIDLFPTGATEAKSFRRDFLITANAAAAVILIMILSAWGVSVAIKKVDESITKKKQTQLTRDTYTLFKEQELVNKRIKQLSNKPKWLDAIAGLYREVNWPGLLNDVKKGTPKTVRVINLSSRDKTRMTLEGLALSYESVHSFVNMLGKSEYIDSASLVGTEKDSESGGLVKYVIDCSIKQQREK